MLLQCLVLFYLLAMPFTDLRSRGIQLKPLNKAAFYIFRGNFLILMVLGAKHVESPYIEFGQISTLLYFAHFAKNSTFNFFKNTLIVLSLRSNSNG